MLFSDIPMDIIHTILSYSEVIRLRNGKYMNQIPKNDSRYAMIAMIMPIYYIIWLEGLSSGHFFKYILFPNGHSLCVSHSLLSQNIIYLYKTNNPISIEYYYERI